jgi:hypothetical protein
MPAAIGRPSIRLAASSRLTAPISSHLVVGGQEAGGHAAAKPREQIGAEPRQGVELAVAGEHHLPALAVERVDGVLELLQRGPLADEKLQVVDHEQVGRAAAAAKAGQAAAVEGLEEAGGELLGRQRDHVHAGVRLPGPAADAVEEVRLAHAGGPVEH